MQTNAASDRRASPNDSFRRHAALEILKTLLTDDKSVRVLWDKYLSDRRPAQLAVDLADELVKELNRS